MDPWLLGVENEMHENVKFDVVKLSLKQPNIMKTGQYGFVASQQENAYKIYSYILGKREEESFLPLICKTT